MINTFVITTKYVIDNKSPVLTVYKDEDGDWQFFGGEIDILEEDASVVSLVEMLNLDPSLGNILWIGNGMKATRASISDEWVTHV
ncbi:hypothetical protein [Flavobacterium cerinum]|uniref:DUF2185 domain-containing protein n=1 Tax=Flavobacterium cerinum TaxID=2502784 RepID=A0ABY5IRI7_9FLAO|nr:hypothetical protein [Flavobacterium cerinum]UUC44162.1 hypothetical protein NOX80_11010 [Flavobacterium cerinum]